MLWPALCVLIVSACSNTDASHTKDAPPNQPTNHPTIKWKINYDDANAQVGTSPPEWKVTAWDGSKPMTLASLRGKVVFVRFWTNTCPFCRASLPAIEQLAKEFAGKPVVFVGLYHAKPRNSPNPWPAAVKTARSWGTTFALGYDKDWATLESWTRNYNMRATSISFILDANGKVAHMHPGPVFHPSTDPAHARDDRDFKRIQAVIRRELTKPTTLAR